MTQEAQNLNDKLTYTKQSLFAVLILLIAAVASLNYQEHNYIDITDLKFQNQKELIVRNIVPVLSPEEQIYQESIFEIAGTIELNNEEFNTFKSLSFYFVPPIEGMSNQNKLICLANSIEELKNDIVSDCNKREIISEVESKQINLLDKFAAGIRDYNQNATYN